MLELSKIILNALDSIANMLGYPTPTNQLIEKARKKRKEMKKKDYIEKTDKTKNENDINV